MDPLIDKRLVEELHKEARKADKIDKERSELFQTLIKHPGWAVYQDLLGTRIQMYGDAIMRPAGSMDGAMALEWIKGAMSGVLLARDLPSATINAITAGPAPEDGEEE